MENTSIHLIHTYHTENNKTKKIYLKLPSRRPRDEEDVSDDPQTVAWLAWESERAGPTTNSDSSWTMKSYEYSDSIK